MTDPTPINDTLNAAIIEQLDTCLSAIAGNDPASERVHTARKHLKRVRALLALRQPQRHLDRSAQALRLVARSLGRVRDAAALTETWSEGAEHINAAAHSAIAELLNAHRASVSPTARESRRLARAERALTAIRERLATALEGEAKEGRKQLARAARRSYGQARHRLRRAIEEPNADSLHALRRAAKRQQYQLQFLEPLWDRPLKAQRKELDRLNELLGAHHDLCAIEALLERDSPARLRTLDSGWSEELQQWRDELFSSAVDLARRAFSEPAPGFERRLQRLFTVRDSLTAN
ncbi:MAG TPA: CHAD domain-containing protein [Polyangiaceae bacterium]|nr:CHAD domain-containing protein [Polyangiaceae bacterium]